MSRAQELKEMRKRNGGKVEVKHFEKVSSDTTIESYYDNILTADDINRAVEMYGVEIDKINDEFAKRTKLTKTDCAFLVLAIALQCTRQYFTQFKPIQDEKATKKNDEANYKKKTSELEESDDANSKQGGYYFAKFEDICADTSVPYDKVVGSKKFDLGLGGKTHRYKTIGHDPMLGYVFGTMNILTNTLTAWDFNSYHIRSNSVHSNANTLKALDSMVNRVKNDPTAVAAALIKQTIHIKSDMYTLNKIPFPGLSEISPELSMTLSKYGMNHANALTIGKQSSLSIAINMIIAMLHRLLMSKDEENNEKLYEVRTRKILLYSNIIATSSNILYVGFSEDINKLDVGGFAVTMYRLFSDPKFIDKVKYEFLNCNLTTKYEEKYGEILMYYSD
ncbi:MAG: hypothetical protein JJE17_01655 [Peptostreptococcaceae bacterium]|nr:hypothetical protein [Peptostreptococcaceae bacterium]